MQGIDLSDKLERYLDLTSAQMKLTAGNMANIDTPGYKTQGIDFGEEFARAIHSEQPVPDNLHRTNVNGLVSRPDGNNVSMDREAMQLAQTQLQFRMGVALLRGEYNGMMKAIHLDDK